MRKMVLVMVILGLIVSQVPYVSAGTTTKTEQLIQDPNFTAADNNKYWSFSYLGGDTQNIDWWFKLHSGYAVVGASSDGTSSTNGGYATLWQKFDVPNVDIISATLVVKDTTHTGGVGDAWIGIVDSVGIFSNGWETDDGSGTHVVNLTDTLQQYEGKSLYIMLGIHIYYWEKFYSASVDYYNATLTIKYKVQTSSGSGGSSGWNGGGSGWYGGGSWWNGGGYWWSGGGTWFGGGGLWFGKGGGNQTYVEFVAANIQRLLAIIGTGLIAVLWVKVGTDYFSRDPDKRLRLRDDTLLAIVGTLIIALAVLGAIWMIAGWVVGASEVIVI